MRDNPRVPILDIAVDAQRMADTVAILGNWLTEPVPRYVCTATVYSIMMCHEDPRIAEAVAHADFVAADGMPLVWLQRRAGYRDVERIYGPDLMLAVCAAYPAARHYMFGGLPGVAQALKQRLLAGFPNLNIVGMYVPPQINIGDSPDQALITEINAAQADILWVGLGSPKQDWWMSAYRPYLNAKILIGVGAAFDFLSGTKRQAPIWMQRAGLEWLFRLAQEPRRLSRRYLVYNTRFIAALIDNARNIGRERKR